MTLRQKSNTPTSTSSGVRTATPSASSVNDATTPSVSSVNDATTTTTTTSNGPIPEVVTLQEFINYSSPVNNVCVL